MCFMEGQGVDGHVGRYRRAVVRYIPLSLFPSSKANDWRNRQHVVLDLFSN